MRVSGVSLEYAWCFRASGTRAADEGKCCSNCVTELVQDLCRQYGSGVSLYKDKTLQFPKMRGRKKVLLFLFLGTPHMGHIGFRSCPYESMEKAPKAISHECGTAQTTLARLTFS